MTTQEHRTLTDPQVSEQVGQQATTEPTPAADYEQSQAQPAQSATSTQREEPAPTDSAAEVLADGPAARAETSTEEQLFAEEDLTEMRGRWAAVQAGFVDDPRECVQQADVLVSDLVEQLTSNFAHARSRLEDQWARGEEASTEDLRVALMHYREFFQRLLAV